MTILALGISNAFAATTYFNLASIPGPGPSASIGFQDNALTSDFEGFFYDYVDLGTASGSQMTATTPAGASLGTFNLSGGVAEPYAYFAYPPAGTSAAQLIGTSGVYGEHYYASANLTNLF